MLEAGRNAGGYLDEIGKTDLKLLEREEWREFLFRLLTGYEAGPAPQITQRRAAARSAAVLMRSPMGAFETHAEALIERGYAAIPIMPGSKIPGYCCAGCGCCCRGGSNATLTAASRSSWSSRPGAPAIPVIGVVGGRASHGLIGIDIDTDDAAIKNAIVKVLPPTPVSKMRPERRNQIFLRTRHHDLAELEHRRQAGLRPDRSRAADRVAADDLIPTPGSPIAGRAPGLSITTPKTCR